jgi:ATP-dependent HslUV protease ATP-binding subunit HslU
VFVSACKSCQSSRYAVSQSVNALDIAFYLILHSFSFVHNLTEYVSECCLTSQTNKSVENIGARRLHTVIERIVEQISFDAPDKAGETVEVTGEYVRSRVAELLTSADLKKYIL